MTSQPVSSSVETYGERVSAHTHTHRTLFAVHGCVVKKEVNSDLLSSRECVSQSRFCLKEKVLSHPRATDGCAVLV